METPLNYKIVGAFVIGFALVFGAYTISNFGQPRFQQAASVATVVVPRLAVAVTDTDGDGVEDWRDTFFTSKPVVLTEEVDTYKPPTTLTGRLGVSFVQEALEARTYGPFARTDEEIITDVVTELETETRISLYDTVDVSIVENWTTADIRNYANAMAGAIERNNVEGLDGELEILNDIIVKGNTERISELTKLALVYRRTRDDSLLVPVPSIFVKQHLDLINTYNAIYNSIDGMTLTINDPMVSLVRIKTYEDDALGLRLALENMYTALEPYANLFTVNDAGVMFAYFSPNNSRP
jgi:hypothetical protein